MCSWRRVLRSGNSWRHLETIIPKPWSCSPGSRGCSGGRESSVLHQSSRHSSLSIPWKLLPAELEGIHPNGTGLSVTSPIPMFSSQTHRIIRVGKDFRDHPIRLFPSTTMFTPKPPPPVPHPCFLSTSRDCDSTAALGSHFQCVTTTSI